MLSVYSLSDELKWKEIIQKSANYDFYHTFHYHNLAFQNQEGEPFLFVYNQNDKFVAVPLLKRKIDHRNNLVDYTSVYGYSGPITNCDPCPELVNNFTIALTEYLKSDNTVSVFSRLHPLINQCNILNGLGEILDLSFTVTIDLNLSDAEQLQAYRKSNKYEINQLRKTSTVKFVTEKEDIDCFIAIYTENMVRVNAHERYFFNDEYFYKFIDSQEYETKILLAYNEFNVPMAGAMFTLTNNIVQYHLAGTSKDFLNKTPMKLILDEMRKYATINQYRFFHLGGGVGNNADSLFNFKAGFSKRTDQFKVWRYIVNQPIYDELVSERIDSIENPDFFPKYRG